jgi:hypothetical protein
MKRRRGFGPRSLELLDGRVVLSAEPPTHREGSFSRQRSVAATFEPISVEWMSPTLRILSPRMEVRQ